MGHSLRIPTRGLLTTISVIVVLQFYNKGLWEWRHPGPWAVSLLGSHGWWQHAPRCNDSFYVTRSRRKGCWAKESIYPPKLELLQWIAPLLTFTLDINHKQNLKVQSQGVEKDVLFQPCAPCQVDGYTVRDQQCSLSPSVSKPWMEKFVGETHSSDWEELGCLEYVLKSLMRPTKDEDQSVASGPHSPYLHASYATLPKDVYIANRCYVGKERHFLHPHAPVSTSSFMLL